MFNYFLILVILIFKLSHFQYISAFRWHYSSPIDMTPKSYFALRPSDHKKAFREETNIMLWRLPENLLILEKILGIGKTRLHFRGGGTQEVRHQPGNHLLTEIVDL